MPKPAYARFFKCDFQLQTPADRTHWQGTLLPHDADDAVFAASADDFVAACLDTGLEAVAVTDHNMGGADGERYLRTVIEAVERQAAVTKRRLVVFPGFEITAKAPGDIHLLCVFEPGTDLDVLSDTLSQLDLPSDGRGPGKKSRKDLDEVLRIVQDERHGLVIAAHADARNGALDDKSLAAIWQPDVICNARLLAIELTRPRQYWQKEKLGEICRNAGLWQRAQPIAVVNSSDNKRLRDGEGKGPRVSKSRGVGSWCGRAGGGSCRVLLCGVAVAG